MKGKTRLVAALIAVVALGVAVLVAVTRAPRAPEDPPRSEAPAAAVARASAPGASRAPSPAPASPDEPGPVLLPGVDSRTHPVDLERLRAEMPDNLYWKTGIPTQDPDVLREREEEQQRWNELHGKVLSNTGSEEEIRRYYDHRRQVSEDAIQFATRVLQQYGDQLMEEERGLYELSIRMHRTRLDEIPRQISEALERKAEQDKRREEWLRSKR